MAGSCLTHRALLLTALLFVTDSLSAACASEDSDFEGSNTATVRTVVGDTAFLRCHIPRRGDQHVSWARQQMGKVMLEHRRSLSVLTGRLEASCSRDDDECLLMIKNVVKSDSGLYLCTDDSQPQFRRSVYLSVFEPTVTILGEPFRVHWQGSAIKLTCVIKPHHGANDVIWMHDDSVIRTSQDFRLTITLMGGGNTVTELLIEDAQPKDSGTYTCKLSEGVSDSVSVEVMQVVKDDFSPMVAGAQQPLGAALAVVLLALGASTTSCWCW